MRDDVEKQWNKKPSGGEEQQPTSQKPSEGSPKQVPPLGVLLRFLTSQVGYWTGENYAQKVCTPVNWPRDSTKHDLDPLTDKKFYFFKSSCLCSHENYAQKYDLSKVFTADTLLNWPSDSRKLRSKVSNDRCTWIMYTSLEWPKDSQKHDLNPLADKKHVI